MTTERQTLFRQEQHTIKNNLYYFPVLCFFSFPAAFVLSRLFTELLVHTVLASVLSRRNAAVYTPYAKYGPGSRRLLVILV